MDPVIVTARVLHIGLGTFWAGAMIFNAAFLLPAMRDAGPDSAKVAAGLMRRNFMNVVPTVAVLTLLSGFYLLGKASVGFGPGYMGSPIGIAFSTGMLASLLAFAIGITMMRPAMMKAATLGQTLATATPADRERIGAEIQALRARAGSAAKAVAWLLGIAVITMAVGRYL
ncbi:MAG: hypothetical protein ACKVZ0_24905 [Gemmatimonadales bacterium]